MIKTVLLIFNPANAWDRIIEARRGFLAILVLYLIPFLILSSLGEAYGLVHWGKLQGQARLARTFPLDQVIRFEGIYIGILLVIVFVSAQLVKAMGETFHGRNTYLQTFTLVAYGLGPMFLFRLFDAFTPISPWATWGVGMLFTVMILYHGVPKVMLPDPPHAFGLFLVTSFILFLATGLSRLMTALYLEGRLGRVSAFSHLALSPLWS
jgi:hypothetical protein